jgi:hypothetical protein
VYVANQGSNSITIIPDSFTPPPPPVTPDLSATLTHAGTFTAGGTGTYTLTVSNAPTAGPTTAPITASVTLAPGLSYVSASGPGWTCPPATPPLPTIVCSNPGPLPPGSTSTLSLTVAIAASTVSPVTTTVSVTTFGEMNPVNNSTTDQTPINPPLDTTPPTTSATTTPEAPNGQNGWFRSDVKVDLSAADNPGGSGVKEIIYTLNGGQPQIVAGSVASFTVSSEGTTTITYFATDNDGSSELPKSLTVKLDKTAPTITPTGRTPAANDDGWNNTDVVVTWSCTDAGSGPTSPTVSQTISSEGTGQSVSGQCTDLAGTTASNGVSAINIDKTAPTATATVSPTPNPAGWSSTNVTVSLNASDTLSGVKSITYSASGAQPTTTTTVPGAGPVAVPITAEGTTTITFTAIDAAGTVSPAQTRTVKIDKTSPPAPMVTDPASAVVVPGAASYTLKGTAEAGSLIRVWGDANANGVKDAGETVAGQQRLADGTTTYAISVPLQQGANTFIVTATDAADNESAPTAVPRIRSAGAADAPDLVLTLKSQGQLRQGTAAAGKGGAYLVKVRNKGQQSTTDPISITATLPTGTAYASSSPSVCTAAGQTVTCTTIGPLAPGAEYQLTIGVDISAPAGTVLTVSARVTTSGDPDLSDNADTDTATVR